MTYQPQRFSAPDGTELVVLAARDYDRLRALADEGTDAIAAAGIVDRIGGGEGTMPDAVLALILDDDLSPLGAWRRYRDLTQAALAKRAGLSQVWVGRIEAGGGYGSRATRRKLAAALDAPEWSLDDPAERPTPRSTPASG